MTNQCKSCGGSISRSGNYYICEFCGSKWEIDSSNDVHAVDRANAWAALRDGDFEKAAELFENIIAKEEKNHEAYWGRALALNGIVYVTDLNENKKVPTCNNITEASFVDHKDVRQAIALAPEGIADGYQQQAAYIEKVRVEWLEKASKEPAYDVFISFKDSDRENGIERTQDSIDAQDLYNALVAEGYKVFFSRISLRDKIAEQYEPYIYNAIKTAKVMIVFGEKAEYFSSVWIKNEWSRFKTRIEKGEKHKNSLVVVYKNMNPGDLPVVLKSRQCLNAADMTFLSDLTRHIKRVVEESKKSTRLEKIEISGGQIAKKASTLTVNAVQVREIGIGAIAETSITEQQSVRLIHSYLSEKQWDTAKKLADDVLFDNPGCAEAILCRLMATHHATSNIELIEKAQEFTAIDYGTIEKLLNCASKELATELLELLYDSESAFSSKAYKTILQTVLPFSFPRRQEKIDQAFENVIKHRNYESFVLLLNTLNASDVEKYIHYNYQYAMGTTDPDEKINCLNNILQVDEGNSEALQAVLKFHLTAKAPMDTLIPQLETLLRYAKNPDMEIRFLLDWLRKNAHTAVHADFAKQLLRYYNGELSSLKEQLLKLSNKLIGVSLFASAEYFLNLILSFDPNNAEVYWAICLIKVGAKSEDKITSTDNLLSDVPEFNRYLTLVDEDRQRHCIQLAKKQQDAFKQRQDARKQEEIKQHNERIQLLKKQQDARKQAEIKQHNDRINKQIKELEKQLNALLFYEKKDYVKATAELWSLITGLVIAAIYGLTVLGARMEEFFGMFGWVLDTSVVFGVCYGLTYLITKLVFKVRANQTKQQQLREEIVKLMKQLR